MKVKTYIVMFKEGTLMFFNKKQYPDHFRKDARFFEAPDDLQIIEICEWCGRCYDHPKIKEINI